MPTTESPSGASCTVTPARCNSRAMQAIRSDSFTRSSRRSRNSVVPLAMAAATASTGISSMERRASSPATVMPRSRLPVQRARTVPTGSPMTWPVTLASRSAPIATRASSTPVRVGFSPTFSTVMSLSGTTSAATSKNAAEDRSPGTLTAPARRWPFHPVGSTTTRRCSGSVLTGAPKKRSMRSL